MTVLLDTDSVPPKPSRILNIITIAAVNLVCFVGLTLGARFAGMAWGWSFLVGWMGGGAATFVVAVVLTILLPVASQRELTQDRRNAERAAALPSAMDLWDLDARADTSPVAQWDMDAAADTQPDAAETAERDVA